MSPNISKHIKIDWLTVLLYFLLVGFGYLNILSASHNEAIISYFNTSELYGKQLIFIGVSLGLIALIFSLEAKFFERFSSVIYIAAIVLLLGLFAFGKNINGATSWYGIGSFTIQPSEFAKIATALALAKFLTDIQTNIKGLNSQLKAFAIILIPAALILLQNDAGSTLVYLSFCFVLFREGIPKAYFIIAVAAILLSVLSLKFGLTVSILITLIVLVISYLSQKNKRYQLIIHIGIFLLCIGFAQGVKWFYDYGLKTHQQNRISLFLRLEKDPKKITQMKRAEAYNLIQSEEAIGSGGIIGKGFMQGTRTTGKFVPEQPTDYIFTTVGEEWGFIGSSLVVIVFVLLMLRVLHLAEHQKNAFSRVYGYGVVAILFTHFTVNIGMVMGLIPTVGIPLPFFSYGGSGLMAFTILLFLFLKLDSNKVNEW